jgi:hypothetical protein
MKMRYIPEQSRGIVLLPEIMKSLKETEFQEAVLYGKREFIVHDDLAYDLYFHMRVGSMLDAKPYMALPVLTGPDPPPRIWKLTQLHPNIDTYASKKFQYKRNETGIARIPQLTFYRISNPPEGQVSTQLEYIIADDEMCTRAFPPSDQQPAWSGVREQMVLWKAEIDAMTHTARRNPDIP